MTTVVEKSEKSNKLEAFIENFAFFWLLMDSKFISCLALHKNV